MTDIFIDSFKTVSRQLCQAVTVGVDYTGGVGFPRLVGGICHAVGATFLFQPGDDFRLFPVGFKGVDLFAEIIIGGIGHFAYFAAL